MIVWLLVVGIALLCLHWARKARRARLAWLQSLNLVGKWECAGQSAGMRRSLTLSGDLASGSYVAKDGDATHRGDWRLRGQSLTLQPKEGDCGDGPLHYELRLFEVGKIGLDGPDRQREVYVKRGSNVIPLRRGPQRG